MLHLLSKANRARQLKGQLMASIALPLLNCIIRDIASWTLGYLRNPSVGLTLNLAFCVISPVLVTQSLSRNAQKWQYSIAGNLPICGSRQALKIIVIILRISFNIFSLVLVCPWRCVFHFMNVQFN